MSDRQQRLLSQTPRSLQAAQAAQQKVWTHDDVFQLFYAIFEHVQQPPHLLPILASPRIAGKATAEASFAICFLCSAGPVVLQYRVLLKLLDPGLDVWWQTKWLFASCLV